MNRIHFGDCRDGLRAMAAAGKKVKMCVSSPPYFGLRDYGHDGQIGLEETPEQYIAELVEVFRAVRDVLADDGTLWVNIGDSYAGSWGNQGRKTERGTQRTINGGMMQQVHDDRYPMTGSKTGSLERTPGCKNKDLIGIPWMLAFALRAGFATCTTCNLERRADLWPVHNGHRVCIDCLMAGHRDAKIVQTETGWYLRQDIIWHKPNPMPESVTDRCTKAHEYVFLLSKSPRYYYDAEAVKETAVSTSPAGNKTTHKYADAYTAGTEYYRTKSGLMALAGVEWQTRNRRSVWTIPTKPYAGAHFAVMAPALVEPCILAGTSERGHCPNCGSRWLRQMEHTPMVVRKTERNEQRGTRTGTSGTMVSSASAITTGWAPSCACGRDPVPDTVLDPFMGSGTTAAVSILNGRDYAGCELNPAYKPLQDQRIAEAIAERAEAEAEAARRAAQLDLFAGTAA